MKILSVIAGSLLVVGSAAAAHNDKTKTGAKMGHETQMMKGTTAASDSADETKKHLTKVELYTQSASNNAKAIYQAAELPKGPMDKVLFREGASNVMRDLAKIEEHLGHIKMSSQAMLGTDRQPTSGREGRASDREGATPATPDTGRGTMKGGETTATGSVRGLGEIKSSLAMARQAANKLQRDLTRMDRTVIRDDASALYSQLQSVSDVLKDVQSAVGASSLDKITPPEKSPVRGFEGMDRDPMNDMNRGNDLNRPEDMNDTRAPGDTRSLPSPTTPSERPIPPPMKR